MYTGENYVEVKREDDSSDIHFVMEQALLSLEQLGERQ